MEKHEQRHKCIIAVTQEGCGIVLKSEPSLFENDDFDGFYLDDNINRKKKDIPKEYGIYSCDIMVKHFSYWTDCGTEYDCDIWLENIVKLELSDGKNNLLNKAVVSGQVCDHHYVPIGSYEQNGRFICTKCKTEM